MREAIGGAMLIKIVMFFIVIYVAFITIAINYSITFRVKNQIINLIEAYEGYTLASDKIDEYIDSVGYYRTIPVLNTTSSDSCDEKYELDGYVICKKNANTVVPGSYYKVTTFVKFDFPIIGEVVGFPVSGETRIIYD